MTAAEDRLGEIEGRAAAALAEWDGDEPTPDPYSLAFALDDVPRLTDALRAVLALHRRVDVYGQAWCNTCRLLNQTTTGVVNPCPTVTAITDALTPAEVKL